jgi:glycine dehydrogenase
MANDKFVMRHIGPRDQEIQEMLETLGVSTLDELMNQTVPENIRLKKSGRRINRTAVFP